MKSINYILIVALMLLFHGCVQGEGMVSGEGETYKIKADLQTKGEVEGFYDKGTGTLTLLVSWTDLFVKGEDEIVGVKIYKGAQRNGAIRFLKYSNFIWLFLRKSILMALFPDRLQLLFMNS